MEYLDARGDSKFDIEANWQQTSNSLWYTIEEGNWDLAYAKPGDVGLDLPVIINPKNERFKPRIKPHRHYYIAPNGSDDDPQPWIDIPPLGKAEISTGLRVKVPEDSWANIKSRSSTGWKKGLNVFEGVIDSGYTGPLFVLVFNPNSEPVRIHEGDRIAQLIIIPKYPLTSIVKTGDLPNTERGDSGFGSSGGHTMIAGGPQA
jgi:dUTP pyrophosphatase